MYTSRIDVFSMAMEPVLRKLLVIPPSVTRIYIPSQSSRLLLESLFGRFNHAELPSDCNYVYISLPSLDDPWTSVRLYNEVPSKEVLYATEENISDDLRGILFLNTAMTDRGLPDSKAVSKSLKIHIVSLTDQKQDMSFDTDYEFGFSLDSNHRVTLCKLRDKTNSFPDMYPSVGL